MDDATKRILLGDILNRVGLDGIGQIVLEQNNMINVGQQQPVQMPPYLCRERAMELYAFLVDGNYIEQSTSSEDFLYLIGVSSNAPLKLKKINWQGTVQQLREMLTMSFEEPLKRSSLKLAEIERRVPLCFLNKGKAMKELAKACTENSYELDALREFFRPK